MKIVLLGAGGQLAHDLMGCLAAHELVPWTRAEVDLAAPEGLEGKLKAAGAQLVINSAAYNLVDKAEEEPEAALVVNALGPLALARACGMLDIPLCHFSTDYVFGLDPSPGRPWRETDAPGPVSVYGGSKLAGEYLVRMNCPRHFVLRTCGLYGVKGSRGKGGNFVETMRRLGAKGGPVRVVNDQACTPSYTGDVARAAAALVETDAYGLYHVTNAGGCTWFEFACEIFRQCRLEVDCRPITSAEFGAKAKRPAYSVLATDKLVQVGIAPSPDWQDGLARYLKEKG